MTTPTVSGGFDSSDPNSDLLAHLRAQTPEALAALLRLRLAGGEQKQWLDGDIVVLLVDHHGWGLARVSEAVGHEKPFLSQLYSCSVAYPPGSRRDGVSWYRHHLARYAASNVAREATRYTGTDIPPDYREALTLIVANDCGDIREATSAVAAEARKQLVPPALDVSNQPLINGCHQMDCRELATLLPRHLAKSIHLDSPYGCHADFDDDSFEPYGSCAALDDCDNENEDSALAVTCDSIRSCPDLLVERGGSVLLWQAAIELRPCIQDAIAQSGLEVVRPVVVWDKGRPQPGRFTEPFAPASEFLYVLKRRGDTLFNHDGSARSNIIRFSPVQQKLASIELRHKYEKPADLNEYLINKFSYPGELVLDLFGCTGSYCLAAAKLKRNWVYCESNPANFNTFAPSLLRKVTEIKS